MQRKTDKHMGQCGLVPFLCAKKSKHPHPETQILSQIPEGEGDKRGQMPLICPGSTPHGLKGTLGSLSKSLRLALIRLPEVNFPKNVTLRMCVSCIQP